MTKRLPGPIDRQLGARLQIRRLKRGLTRKELADQVGVHPSQIRDYERGEARVVASRLIEISFALGVPVAWFFEDLSPGSDVEIDKPFRILTRFLEAPEALVIIENWPNIGANQRQALSALIELLAREAGTADRSDGTKKPPIQ